MRKQRAVKTGVDAPTVRIGITTVIPELLRNLGADPVEVLAEVGLDSQLFSDPANTMSLFTRGKLFSHCVARTGCKHFGLLIGQTGRLSALGLLGFLMQHSPDVEAALRSFVRLSHLVVRGAGANFTVHGDFAILGYAIHQPGVEATDQAGDGAMAMYCNIMRTLCGTKWNPVEVWFAHRTPEDVEPYRHCFQAPLRFDAEQYAVVFPAAWLSHRLPDDDPELRRMLNAQIDAIRAEHQDDFPEQVRNVLRTALVTGHGKADQIAALFSMQSRTLNRRLSDSGTHFQTLVDEVRFEIARQMLLHSTMALSDIAVTLGYADASAFTRAFRRWTGVTPSVWRTKQAGAA